MCKCVTKKDTSHWCHCLFLRVHRTYPIQRAYFEFCALSFFFCCMFTYGFWWRAGWRGVVVVAGGNIWVGVSPLILHSRTPVSVVCMMAPAQGICLVFTQTSIIGSLPLQELTGLTKLHRHYITDGKNDGNTTTARTAPTYKICKTTQTITTAVTVSAAKSSWYARFTYNSSPDMIDRNVRSDMTTTTSTTAEI